MLGDAVKTSLIIFVTGKTRNEIPPTVYSSILSFRNQNNKLITLIVKKTYLARRIEWIIKINLFLVVLPEFWFLGMLHLSWLSLDWASGFRPAGHWWWLPDGRFPRERPLSGLPRAKLLSNRIDSNRRLDRAWAGPCPPDPWAWAMLVKPSIRPEMLKEKFGLFLTFDI